MGGESDHIATQSNSKPNWSPTNSTRSITGMDSFKETLSPHNFKILNRWDCDIKLW